MPLVRGVDLARTIDIQFQAMWDGVDAGAALGFLEAAYAWDIPPEQWLSRLAQTAIQVWGGRRWACGFTYDMSDPHRFSFSNPVLVGGSPLVEEFLVHGLSKHTPDTLAASFGAANTIGFGRDLGVIDEEDSDRLARLETVDLFGLNARDTSGRGCFLGLGADRTTLNARETLIFQRLSFHLASAYRLRRRLAERDEEPLEHWEALLDPSGTVLETRGPADSGEGRRVLALAAQSQEVVRRRTSMVEPTERWRPRVAGRWTLIDAFTRAGRRYIVARENETPLPGLGVLTEREQQVVASATSGKTNKEIAYDLGISSSTARVLLARAYRRLGVRSRAELLRHPSIKALRG